MIFMLVAFISVVTAAPVIKDTLHSSLVIQKLERELTATPVADRSSFVAIRSSTTASTYPSPSPSKYPEGSSVPRQALGYVLGGFLCLAILSTLAFSFKKYCLKWRLSRFERQLKTDNPNSSESTLAKGYFSAHTQELVSFSPPNGPAHQPSNHLPKNTQRFDVLLGKPLPLPQPVAQLPFSVQRKPVLFKNIQDRALGSYPFNG